MAEEGEELEVEMEASAASGPIPFQLQFDKPFPFQIKIAEWNPEKDLLAMVTEDSKVLLHRFNWQRLWTISPGKCITALCWRPDGKAISLGLEDGSILLHDVENGKLLRSIKSHNVAVVCLNWEEDTQLMRGDNKYTYEDRTMRFFPPAPTIPRMPGLGSGDTGLMDDPVETYRDFSNSSHQRFNILCSGDKDGFICFSIFGIFPIGKINIHKLSVSSPFSDKRATYQLHNASIRKVALSKNLRQLVVLSLGELVEDLVTLKGKFIHRDGELVEPDKSSCGEDSSVGMHCLILNTSIFLNRKNELHQVALQASSIEDLIEVVRASLSVMSKQWSDTITSFHEKFDSLSSLIVDHGLESNSQDEFLSLLFGARTSPALHQFLVNSLGEVRVSKAVDNAGKDLHVVVHEHLQPAVEIIGFRIGELRGLSRWRARYQTIGLDEKLIDNATEKAGMLHVQVERFSRVLATVLYQLQNFFNWVSKCIKILLSDPTDQIQPPNSELVVIFLKFLLDHDPVGQLLEADHTIDVDPDTKQRVEQLVMFGGFLDTKFLERTLANEFSQLEQCLKEAFLMPFTTISKKIHCEDLLPLYPIPSSPVASSLHAPTSISYYKDNRDSSPHDLVDYICFRIPDESMDLTNCIGIIRGSTNTSSSIKDISSPGAVLLCIPDGYHCMDLSLYKQREIVLLLNEAITTSESPGRSWMMMVQISDLSFMPLSRLGPANLWKLHELKLPEVLLVSFRHEGMPWCLYLMKMRMKLLIWNEFLPTAVWEVRIITTSKDMTRTLQIVALEASYRSAVAALCPAPCAATTEHHIIQSECRFITLLIEAYTVKYLLFSVEGSLQS
ncbi:anaphase-promoting complex subunit 4 isoform X2 [Phoenix dactylifera]|uniref:Anaphase-promoting complex subunit 4 n=1 Tax=Phoenix dactylifera TaxID=42345 RepID=A0A8B9A6W6_PHODC|nr:anaphase-promoting complex subunit 4 isoform X2 [Phoenix dactylifera]